MKVLISGATGLIGTELIRQLKELGHTPLSLTRNENPGPDPVFYSPRTGVIDPQIMNQVDAVVNLAGATTGRIPWTKKYMSEIIDSRLLTTELLVRAINEAENPPKVLV